MPATSRIANFINLEAGNLQTRV